MDSNLKTQVTCNTGISIKTQSDWCIFPKLWKCVWIKSHNYLRSRCIFKNFDKWNIESKKPMLVGGICNTTQTVSHTNQIQKECFARAMLNNQLFYPHSYWTKSEEVLSTISQVKITPTIDQTEADHDWSILKPENEETWSEVFRNVYALV